MRLGELDFGRPSGAGDLLEEFVHVAVGVEEVVVLFSRFGIGIVAGLPDVLLHALWETGEVLDIERCGRVGGEWFVDEVDAVEHGARVAGGGDDVDALSPLVVDPGGLRTVGGPADGTELALALSLPLFESLDDAGAAVFELGESDEGEGMGDPPLYLRCRPGSR